MKKAFTLVEMLIVVVVLVTLMSMVFKLGSVGGSSAARNVTISRLQRVENCLSGYYAAFGTYPPVALHGSRNIYVETYENGVQKSDNEVSTSLKWKNVEAACRSQPVDACFPFPDSDEYKRHIERISRTLQEKANKAAQGDDRYKLFNKDTLRAGFDTASTDNIGSVLTGDSSKATDWRNVQLFRFGLMSYLLPRYIIMTNGDKNFFTAAQWKANNTEPRDPLNDEILDWEEIHKILNPDKGTVSAKNYARISNIPSQAVTARWMPNLEGIVASQHTWNLYGINVSYSDSEKIISGDNPNIDIYAPDPNSHTHQYVLDSVTVLDGWHRTFYYYSPAPYQSYVLWSAGPDGKTFPPWVPLNSQTLSPTDRATAGSWIKDDIIQLSK